MHGLTALRTLVYVAHCAHLLGKYEVLPRAAYAVFGAVASFLATATNLHKSERPGILP